MFYPTIMQVLTHFVQVLTLISANILQLPRLFRQILYRSTKKTADFHKPAVHKFNTMDYNTSALSLRTGYIFYHQGISFNFIFSPSFIFPAIKSVLQDLHNVFILVLYTAPEVVTKAAGMSVSNVLPQHAQILMYFFISLTFYLLAANTPPPSLL